MLGLAVSRNTSVGSHTDTERDKTGKLDGSETPAEGPSLGASLAHTNNKDWWVEGRRCRPREDGGLFA